MGSSVLHIANVILKRILKGKHDVAALRRARWAVGSLTGIGKGDGLTLAMDMAELKSLSQLGRDFIDRIADTHIPFEVFDIGCDPDAPKVDAEELASAKRHNTERISNRRVMIFAAGAVEKNPQLFNILTPFWEFESGMLEVAPDLFHGVNHLAVFSRFCERYFRSIAPAGVGVNYIRYPLPRDWRMTEERIAVRSRFKIAADDFVVFFHFDFRSGYDRKNPVGALRAFLKAFGDDPRTKMVIKAGGGDWDLRNGVKFRSVIKELGIGKRLVLADKFMGHQEILNLIGASDAYLSMHRGEGLGIGMLEAMSVGTPVIATRYGGNMDFTNDETAFMVGYRMVKPKTTYGLYRYVSEWPEPDEDEAANHLRMIRDSPSAGRDKADAAGRFIAGYFSTANFENDVRSLLSATSLLKPATELQV